MLQKKFRIINLKITKQASFYDNAETTILENIKIPLTRVFSKCGKRCELEKCCQGDVICGRLAMFGKNKIYNLIGILQTTANLNYSTWYSITSSTYNDSLLCSCNYLNNKYVYIFTFETIRKYIPREMLLDMGIYKEPKIKGKDPKNKIFQTKQYYTNNNIDNTKINRNNINHNHNNYKNTIRKR